MELLKFELPTGAVVTACLHGDSPDLNEPLCKCRPAVVLCPGGGYSRTSAREKDSAVAEFFAMGAQVFMLEYSVGEKASGKRPLEEVARTVLAVRQDAQRWLVDPHKVIVMGFSAGGHLAASIGVHWDDPEIAQRCGVEDPRILRPDGMILCYPVITTDDKLTHAGTKRNVTAGSSEPAQYWSLETQVKETTPPAFIWHTMADASVPVENSLKMAYALHSHGISCELHLFPKGAHGLSMCTVEVGTPNSVARMWMPLCRNWMNDMFGPVLGW